MSTTTQKKGAAIVAALKSGAVFTIPGESLKEYKLESSKNDYGKEYYSLQSKYKQEPGDSTVWTWRYVYYVVSITKNQINVVTHSEGVKMSGSIKLNSITL